MKNKASKTIVAFALAAIAFTAMPAKAQSPTPAPTPQQLLVTPTPSGPTADERATQVATQLVMQVNFTCAQIKSILQNGAPAVAAHGSFPALPAVSGTAIQSALTTANLAKLNAAIVDLGGTVITGTSSVARPLSIQGMPLPQKK